MRCHRLYDSKVKWSGEGEVGISLRDSTSRMAQRSVEHLQRIFHARRSIHYQLLLHDNVGYCGKSSTSNSEQTLRFLLPIDGRSGAGRQRSLVLAIEGQAVCLRRHFLPHIHFSQRHIPCGDEKRAKLQEYRFPTPGKSTLP